MHDRTSGDVAAEDNSSPLLAQEITSQAEMASQMQHLSHLTRALSGEKHFLRALVDSVEDALVAFGKDGHFVLCNRRFEELFNVNAEQLNGRDEAWLHEQLASRLNAPDGFFAAGTDAQLWGSESHEFIVELRSQGQSDDTRVLERPRVLRWYSGSVHDGEGQLVGRVAVQRDITKEIEVDRMKSEFISIVSHELRTPMTSIKGYVDLILDGDTGEINHLQREFLQTVQRNTRRLVAMINDMLDIERIESGGIEFDIRPLVLSDVLEQALSLVKPQADEKNLTIDVIEPQLVGRVLADFDRTLQVLTNLLSNAVKYTPAPPVSPGRILVTVQFDELHARIAVSDTGIGISVDDQAQLFQKFFRADNSVTREVGGTGLGLSITRALVEKMGGELAVSSTVGHGSEFSFTLPLANKPKRPRKASTPASHSTRRQVPRILVVDDDPDIVDLISLYLQRNGYETTGAYSGPEALRMLRDESYDAMTLDVLMPHMDGFDVLRRMKEEPALAELPIVIVSVTNAPLHNGQRLDPELHLGNYNFITKPFDEDLLRSTLSRALHPHAAADDTAAEGTAPRETVTPIVGDASTRSALSALREMEPDSCAVLVDPDGDIEREIGALLREQNAAVATVATPAEALAASNEHDVDLIVLNPLPWGDQTLQLVEALSDAEGGAPFVLFTQPDDKGQYVISPITEHAADAAVSDTPQALRDICARLDHLLEHDSGPAGAGL